jgi:uncharacterized protein YdeI (YjbR/CyaY-like superfamily)
MPVITETVFATDRAAWRSWLAAHHDAKKEIWLIFFKAHTGKPSVTYRDAVEEALCFGWIDGIIKRIDDEKYAQRFSPRRPGSRWSESNKARVRKMIREGLMTPTGMALVEAGKKSGAWHNASAVERPDAAPAGLDAALAKNTKARRFWESLPPSYRRLYAAWVLDAKRDETRAKRVATVVSRCADGKKPGIDL